MALIPKNDVNQIFGSQAPDQDKPAQFNNYTGGWDASRINNGKPTIKQFNYLQQRTDQNILYIHQNGGALPYDSTIEYAENATVLIDGELKQKKGNQWISIGAKTAKDILASEGVTQFEKNNIMSKSKLGHKVKFDNLTSSVDSSGKRYPQGGCKVGSSLFLKIATGNGTVGTYSEEFIIVEYDFESGSVLAESQPIQTLGHHELSGFIKDGKKYLLTSYQPESAGSRSGVGISVIEWKGSQTKIENVSQYELLDQHQSIGFPCCDEEGKYVYMTCNSNGSAGGSGYLQSAPTLLMNVFYLDDVIRGVTVPLYTFNISIPSGDGITGARTLNGLTASKDHIYVVFGGAYGITRIHKYSTEGNLIDVTQTALGRSARPRDEVFNQTTFLYNTEPEAVFLDKEDIYLVTAEDWYGNGEIVKFNNHYYMARYAMSGKSPASHADHWMKMYSTVGNYPDYDPLFSYTGRNTSISSFKRTLIKISLKDSNNYDLLMSDSVGEIPNLINNAPERVHLYGNLKVANELTFGMYDYERQTFQKNMTIFENGIKLFDTRYSNTLNNKTGSIRAYKLGSSSLITIEPDDNQSTDRILFYGRYHGSSDESTINQNFIRNEADGNLLSILYRDGRSYNYSTHATIGAKVFVGGVEKLGVYSSNNSVLLDTAEKYMWFGKSSGSSHSTSTLGINHDTKTVYPPSNGATALGMRNQRFSKAWLQGLNAILSGTYEDNASAKAGGLTEGEFYKTSIGQVMVVF